VALRARPVQPAPVDFESRGFGVMSAKTPTQADSDCITAQTWMSLVDPEDPEFGQREADALDAGQQAYRVIDAFGKSGAKRLEREKALAGALLTLAQRLYARDRESMKRELEFAIQCERERTNVEFAKALAAAHAALDSVKNRP
jgi:hypothetical protein